MTEHPAAPTTEVATTFLAAVAGATVSGKTVTIKDVNLDELRELFTRIEAEARAAARKEVLDRLAMREVSVGPLDAYSKRSVLEVLDSLSTDTREATDVSE